MGTMHGAGGASAGTIRRLIFLRVEAPQPNPTPDLVFAIGATRVPEFFADVDMPNLALLDIRPLGPGTGWGQVPTPMF